jgi:peptide/nickel transport system substrate-binding protein
MKVMKIFGWTASLLLLATTVMAVDLPQTLPRNETLYVGGLIWGPPQNFNPLNSNSSFPISYGNKYELVYESLFMYNQLTNEAEPLLGTKYAWDKDGLTLKIEMNTAAKFNNGKPVTAEDAAYSYMLAKTYALPWSSYMDYIDTVTASGSTVSIKMNAAKPNKLFVLDSLSWVPIVPKAVWSAIEDKAGKDGTKILGEFNAAPVGSGPYKVAFYDDTRVVLIRDDTYCGKVLFGKLAAPKYLVHIIYKSNDACSNAFRNGEIDINQQFMPKIWDLWKDGKPFKTYLKNAPYYLPGMMPSIIFNMTKPGIGSGADAATVRRAIGMSIDYKKIADVAMSGYSATVVPGIILQTPAEKALVDESKTKNLQFKYDVDGANALLDKISTKGADGVRVLKDGTRLGPYEISCPYGWSDWNASLEIVSQSAKKIGIEIRTKFPEFPVWFNDVKNGNFDIAMWNTTAPGVAQPWDRARGMMDSSSVPPIGQPVVANNNWGRYKNARADELIDQIPKVTDPVQLKALYTELNTIYLTDLPTIELMYRPGSFYEVYEGVWKGLPDEKANPKNISPTPITGSFVKAFYNISSK